MTSKSFPSKIGIGATQDLSLRVSVATLVRVLFENPKDGELMLALERKATLLQDESGHFVDVKAQPFGGAIRIHDPKFLQAFIGNFRFDCEASRLERDFRIFIRPSAWEKVKALCLGQFSHGQDLVLETDPTRELAEEVAETLKISLTADQFVYKPVGTLVENLPSPTENIFARGSHTVRIYRIFEAHILDTSLAKLLRKNGESYSDVDLRELALEDARNGGPGWANSVLSVPLDQLNTFYLSIPPQARNRPAFFQGHQLDETVAGILPGMAVPKFQGLEV